MSAVSLGSVAIYQKLLLLYPKELRRDFGDEMILAFEADLEERGSIYVWQCAIRELLSVALPGQRSNPYVLSPALAFLATALIETAFFWMGVYLVPRMGAQNWDSTWPVMLFESSFHAIVAFVVTCFYSRCSINVLVLD